MTRSKTPSSVKTAVPTASHLESTQLKPNHLDAVHFATVQAHSPATRRAYASAWKGFVTWCEAEGYQSLPADAATVAAYLTDRADGSCTVATLRIARAAIRYRHESDGLSSPTQTPGVQRVLRGLTRRAAVSASMQGRGQTDGIRAADLSAIRATALNRRTGAAGRRETEKRARRRGRVDIAIISVMRDALLRRSEAVALRWRDIEFRCDGTGRLLVRRSKTDQEGGGAVLYLGPEATADLKAIRPREVTPDDIASQRVFGLQSSRSIANRVKAAAEAAGLDGRYSGHSPRVGMAMDLVASGASIAAAMIAGRWTSSRMPAHYARGEIAGRGAVARFYESR